MKHICQKDRQLKMKTAHIDDLASVSVVMMPFNHSACHHGRFERTEPQVFLTGFLLKNYVSEDFLRKQIYVTNAGFLEGTWDTLSGTRA